MKTRSYMYFVQCLQGIEGKISTLKYNNLTTIRKVKILQKLDALLQTSKYSELSIERVFTEVKVKHSSIVHLATLPVGIGHSNLIQICEKINENMPMQYIEIFKIVKNENFQWKNFDIVLIFAQNIDCEYTVRTASVRRF